MHLSQGSAFLNAKTNGKIKANERGSKGQKGERDGSQTCPPQKEWDGATVKIHLSRFFFLLFFPRFFFIIFFSCCLASFAFSTFTNWFAATLLSQAHPPPPNPSPLTNTKQPWLTQQPQHFYYMPSSNKPTPKTKASFCWICGCSNGYWAIRVQLPTANCNSNSNSRYIDTYIHTT